MNIGVLDYGAGNLRNVCRAIEHLGYRYTLVSNTSQIADVDKLIIPGVGAFKIAMEQLASLDMIAAIDEFASRKMPILGICLGMQLLFEESFEFGLTKGLGLIPGCVNKIPSEDVLGNSMKVPHIGWNELVVDSVRNNMISSVEKGSAVYFVHSYRAEGVAEEHMIAHCVYGGLKLPAIVGRDHIVGCQFHPEKSGRIGLSILNNFLR